MVVVGGGLSVVEEGEGELLALPEPGALRVAVEVGGVVVAEDVVGGALCAASAPPRMASLGGPGTRFCKKASNGGFGGA